MLSMTGAIEHCLEMFAHGSELVSPNVEGIVHASRIEGRTKVDSLRTRRRGGAAGGEILSPSQAALPLLIACSYSRSDWVDNKTHRL